MDTKKIKDALARLEAAQADLAQFEKILATLHLREGQETASIHINGVGFPLTYVSPQSGWRPELSERNAEVHAAAVKLTESTIVARRVRLNDAVNALKAAVKEL